MKTFLLKTTGWILSILICFAALLYPITSDVFADRKKVYIQKKHSKNYDLLILGSSRAEHGIVPALLDTAKNVFNMGENGNGMPSNYIMLKLMLTHYGIHINTLLLQVDEYSFNGSKGFSREFRDDNFYYDLDDNEVYDAVKAYRGPAYAALLHVFPQAGNLIYNDFSHFIKNYPFVFKSISGSLQNKYDQSVNVYAADKGYAPIYEAGKALQPPAEKAHYILEPDDVAYFNKLVALCRKYNIRLYLYRMPVMYCNWEDSQAFDQFIRTFCQQNNVPFFDYKCNYQNSSWYYDHTHATDTIARMITMDIRPKLTF